MTTAQQRIDAARPWIEEAARKLGPPQRGSVAWCHQQALEALTATAAPAHDDTDGSSS